MAEYPLQTALDEPTIPLTMMFMLSFVLLSTSGLKAIEDNILEWVSLLHMRTPLCTVMLVASHYDELRGTPEENEQLLATVEKRCVPESSRYFTFVARKSQRGWALPDVV